MKHQEIYDVLMAQLLDEFPEFVIVRKSESRLMKVLAFLHWMATFGSKKFMETFTTCVGTTVYVPESWDDERKSLLDKIVTLRHERVHMRQRRRHGAFVHAFLYMGPFPVGFAWGRAKLEMEAYEESMNAIADLRGTQFAVSKEYREHLARHFVGPEYLWMWVLRSQVDKWIDDACRRVVDRHLRS